MWKYMIGLLMLVAMAGCGSSAAPGAGSDEQASIFDDIIRPIQGGTVHRVRMMQQGDRYAFEPSEVVARRGDVVRFVMVGSQPESVVFDVADLTTEQAEFISANGLDSGILLTVPGATMDASFADAPDGRYPFLSIPHHAAGMRGGVTIVSDDS